MGAINAAFNMKGYFAAENLQKRKLYQHISSMEEGRS